MAKLTSPDHFDASVLSHVRKDFVRVLVADTVGEALARVQRSQVAGRIVYFYVVDEEGHLRGVVPTRRLLLNRPEVAVADIMERSVIALPASATLLDACEFFIMHRLLAVPVVDEDHRIVGVVDVELYTDQISDVARRQESEDVFQLIGVRVARVRQRGLPAAYRGRFPWLLCNIGGGLACAFLAALYEQTLAKAVVLAMFIPVVLALAESVSIQSLTLTLQLYEAGSLRGKRALGALRGEATVGLLLGLSCGGLVGLVAWLWQGRFLVAACILLSIALAVTTAALFGLAVPTVLRAVQRDPKLASGPIALAMTDIATLFYYLGFATLVLR
jgi:magnesium transporter